MPALTVGDLAPWFLPPSLANRDAHENTMIGGYRAVLFFFGSSRTPEIHPIVSAFLAAQATFEQQNVTFFGVSVDPGDAALEQQVEKPTHFKFLLDVQGDLSIEYGVCQLDRTGEISYDPTTFVLDENLRVVDRIPLETHIPHVDRVLQAISQFPSTVNQSGLIRQQAPVLLIPNVLPPEFCKELIALYEADGGTESGFMSQGKDGKTSIVLNPNVKRRRDFHVTDPALLERINSLIWRRVIPEVQKAFHFTITQYERYMVGCYEARNQGFFQPHRDNTSIGSAHRRFAMSINLNAGEYEGGCLRFSEYGQDLYAPDTGGAIVFSCSLLHEATPVTQGRRFALLSFFFDDEGAKLRQQTMHQIVRTAPEPAPAAHKPDRAKKTEKASLGFQRKHKK